jgi:hypothetical protein
MSISTRAQAGFTDIAIAVLERMIAGLHARRESRKVRKTAAVLASLDPRMREDLGLEPPSALPRIPAVHSAMRPVFCPVALRRVAREERRVL